MYMLHVLVLLKPRIVLTGLLPECMKVVGMEEQERRRVEARVAKAVVKAQAVAARLLGLYGTATRKLRAERREQLKAWCGASKVAVYVVIQHIDGARVGRWRAKGWWHDKLWGKQHLLDGADRVYCFFGVRTYSVTSGAPVLRTAVNGEVFARPEVLDEAELVRHALVHGSEAQQQLAEEVDVCRIFVIDGNKARRCRAEPKACRRDGPVQ